MEAHNGYQTEASPSGYGNATYGEQSQGQGQGSMEQYGYAEEIEGGRDNWDSSNGMAADFTPTTSGGDTTTSGGYTTSTCPDS